MRLRHVINAQQFNRAGLEEMFKIAKKMESVVAKGGNRQLLGEIMATLFYEPSTRTRLSFETAMLRLGGEVISTENAREFSSHAKGETLEDTIRIVNGYADVIVLRHYEEGAAERAATVSDAPILNAGDGPGQHPTQSLLDLYTIQKELGRIDGIKIAMVGDLAYGRTVRSLCYFLAKFEDVKIYFVAPEVVKMRDDIKEYLTRHKTHFEEETDLKKVTAEVDVLYQTRIQKERFSDQKDYERACGVYVIDREIMKVLPKYSVVMHPLPRVGEILPEVDEDSRAAYFRQANNGLFIRMALLSMVLS